MQRLEVSGAVRLIYKSLGVKGLIMNKKGQWARKYKLQVTENGIVRELFS